jgi:hypothetical protein
LTDIVLPTGSGNTAPFYFTGTLTVHVPMGTVSVYESVWGVSASTSYYGNPSVYGNNHKAIEIVE